MPEIKKYEKTKGTVTAMQWDGSAESASDIIDWILKNGTHSARYWSADNVMEFFYGTTAQIHLDVDGGVEKMMPNDFIVLDGTRNAYIRRPDFFNANYHEANPETSE